MTLPIPNTVLFNLTNTIFDFFAKEENQEVITLLRDVLRVFDITVDFKERNISYQVDADDFVLINYSTSKAIYKEKFKITPYIIPKRDLEYIEKIFEGKEDNIVTKFTVLFDILGYVLFNKEGRWIIRWAR